MRLTIAAVFGFLLASAPIHADVIIDNLSSPTASGREGYLVSESETLGAAFMPGGEYLMTGVQVQTFAYAGSDFTFDAFLYADSGGLPSSEIAELGSGLTAPSYGGGPNVINLGTPIDLTSGVQYWLVLTPADARSNLLWELGGPSTVPMADSFNGSPFGVFSESLQFEIEGTPLSAAPEPAAPWFLAAVFFMGMIVFRKWRAQ